MEVIRFGLGENVPNVGMSAAVRFGEIIAISGQVALNKEGELIGKGDFAAQAEQCFANLAAVLKRAGSSLRDVVMITSYLTSAQYAPAFLAARAKYFPEQAPASTTVVAQLLNPDLLVEIQALAVISRPWGT